MRKLLYHDNPVRIASLPVVYYEYISLCSQYAIKDHHCVQESTLESLFGMFLVTVYFGIY